MLDVHLPTTANSIVATTNAARIPIYLPFIEIDPSHLVHASVEFRHCRKAFGTALLAPVQPLFQPRLLMVELSRGKPLNKCSRTLCHGYLPAATIIQIDLMPIIDRDAP